MKITPLSLAQYSAKAFKNVSFGDIEPAPYKSPFDNVKTERYEGINSQTLCVKDGLDLFEVENISNSKIGTKFLLHPKDPEFKDLTILYKPSTVLKSEKSLLDFHVSSPLSFKGQVWGSIRKDDEGKVDENMENSYYSFLDVRDGIDNVSDCGAKDDYNFFIPSDGDGTRYRDITLLQGGCTKPASYIPATLNGNDMKLVHGILTNFARTSKLDKNTLPNFVEVTPAKGSAYAFLEGLKSGKIPVDKPVVFSWGDNFSDINIAKIMKYHEDNNAGMTMLTLPVNTDRIKSLGAAKVMGKDDLRMTDFYEKPKEDDLVKEFIIPGTKDKCLGVVGPYVLSTPALQWLKENYTKHPENFKDDEGCVDFSRKVLGNLLPLMTEGVIKDSEGNALPMLAYEKPEDETWSDLGSEKDFTQEMKNVKNGSFKYLPDEMKESISKNVDRFGNITFSESTKHKLADFLDKYEIDLQNATVYSK